MLPWLKTWEKEAKELGYLLVKNSPTKSDIFGSESKEDQQTKSIEKKVLSDMPIVKRIKRSNSLH